MGPKLIEQAQLCFIMWTSFSSQQIQFSFADFVVPLRGSVEA